MMSKTLKRTGLVLSLGALLVFSGLAMADDMSNMPGMSHDSKMTDKSNAKTTTITGEVVGTACYVAEGAKGEKHEECAQMCIDSGIPAAILTSSGKLYIVLGENHKAPAEVVKGFIAKQVKVTGKVVTKGGSTFITVSKIAEAKSESSKKMESKESKEKKSDSMKE